MDKLIANNRKRKDQLAKNGKLDYKMDKTKYGLKHIPFWLRIRAFT